MPHIGLCASEKQEQLGYKDSTVLAKLLWVSAFPVFDSLETKCYIVLKR